MVVFTVLAMAIFLGFQVLYTLVPLFTTKKKVLDGSEGKRTISVIVPAYNEELTINNCIQAFNNVDYDGVEAVIVNDGSKDGTLSVLSEILDLEEEITRAPGKELNYQAIKKIYKSKKFSNIYVIDKNNGGKADALNAGIDFANSEIVITLDADSMLEKESLKFIDKYFDDEDVVAAGGTVLIVQGTKKVDGRIKPVFKGSGIIKHQIFHYVHGFYVKKQTQSVFNSIVVISGAFGAFNKDILVNVGGFRPTVGEDIDITLKVYKYLKENGLDHKRLVYAPEAVCYTECPENIRMFFKQRYRWQKAFIDCIVEYWDQLFVNFSNRLSIFFAVDGFILGTVSAFATLYMLFVLAITRDGVFTAMVLILIATLVDIVQTSVGFVIAHKYGYGYSFMDYVKILLFMPLDKLIYKLFPVYINIAGSIKYFFEDDDWGTIERKGEVNIL